MEEETKTVKDELKDIKSILEETSKAKKEKKFRLPFKAKISKGKLRKGYLTVCIVNENNSVDFKKYQITDGTIKIEDTIHAIEQEDIFTYKNKPFVIQPKWLSTPHNPINPNKETYGQKYIMSRMESDKIVGKRKLGGWGLSIGALIIGGVIIYALLTGGA